MLPEELKTLELSRRVIKFTAIAGVVTDVKLWSETEIRSARGAYGLVASVDGEVTELLEMFVRTDDGREVCWRFANSPVRVRKGNRVLAVYAGGNMRHAIGKMRFFRNLDMGKTWSMSVDSMYSPVFIGRSFRKKLSMFLDATFGHLIFGVFTNKIRGNILLFVFALTAGLVVALRFERDPFITFWSRFGVWLNDGDAAFYAALAVGYVCQALWKARKDYKEEMAELEKYKGGAEDNRAIRRHINNLKEWMASQDQARPATAEAAG